MMHRSETDVERMIPMTPEAFAALDVKDGLATDLQAETIAYYRRFVRGKNAEIERLYGLLKETA